MVDSQTSAAPLIEPLPRDRLSTRILAASLTALVIALTMIFGTLWLSWQLEGAAAAINDTGSLRMRTSRIGLYLAQHDVHETAQVAEETALNGQDAGGIASWQSRTSAISAW